MNLTPFELPNPSPAEKEVAAALKLELEHLIQSSQTESISFSQFMNHTLFSNLGYYKNGLQKFGSQGDFITAPEMGNLFAHTLKPILETCFENLGKNVIFEIGSGSGQLMLDLFLLLEQSDHPIEHYFVLEVSSDLKQRQKRLMQQKAPAFLNRITWLDTLPTIKNKTDEWIGVILANEVLDTFGFDLFTQVKQGQKTNQINLEHTFEKKVTLTHEKELGFKLEPLSESQQQQIKHINQRICEFEQTRAGEFFNFEAGYTSELPIHYQPWLKSIHEPFSKAISLWFDYGLSMTEYYAPFRNRGTFRLFYRHLLHTNPFDRLGLSDMTSHVNFSNFCHQAEEMGCELVHYTTLAQFMQHCPTLDLMQKTTDFKKQMQLSSELKRLVLPSEMGEIFKWMMLYHDASSASNADSLDFSALSSRDLSHLL